MFNFYRCSLSINQKIKKTPLNLTLSYPCIYKIKFVTAFMLRKLLYNSDSDPPSSSFSLANRVALQIDKFHNTQPDHIKRSSLTSHLFQSILTLIKSTVVVSSYSKVLSARPNTEPNEHQIHTNTNRKPSLHRNHKIISQTSSKYSSPQAFSKHRTYTSCHSISLSSNHNEY